MDLPTAPTPSQTSSAEVCVLKDNCFGGRMRVARARERSLREAVRRNFDAYGNDPVTQEAVDTLRDLISPRAEVIFGATGTFVNTLGCSLLVDPPGVACTSCSHLKMMENGGPETLAKITLHTIPHVDGKLDVAKLIPVLDQRPDIHIVHVTQCTELGTVYRAEELKVIGELCRERRLLFGIDGARLPHAALSLQRSAEVAEFTTNVGADFLTLGVAKIGGASGNALIVIDRERTAEKGHEMTSLRDLYGIAKQRGGTPSNLWDYSCQFIELFGKRAWRAPVGRALGLAQTFAAGLAERGIRPAYPIETNACFIRLSEVAIRTLYERGWRFYQWPGDDPALCRFMFSFRTPRKQLSRLLTDMHELHDQGRLYPDLRGAASHDRVLRDMWYDR